MFRFLVLIAGIIAAANAYKTGAPTGVCDDLTPQHGEVPQTKDSPYKITINKSVIRPENKVEVTLEGIIKGETFKGFLLQARDGEDKQKIVGSFQVDPKDADKAQTIECTEKIKNAVTHKNSEDKSSITVQWQAPKDFKGVVVFLVTFVKDGSTYWVKQPSAELKVAH